jgi:disulfide bond formation protein DsbB
MRAASMTSTPRVGLASPRVLLAAALAVGLAAIIGAWAFQILGGYLPCKLCLQQRIPYYAGLPLLALGAVLIKPMPTAGRLLALAGGVVFLAGAGLGGYHAGAEWGFWQGPTDCGGGTPPTTNAADLLAQMQATRLVSCTEASIRFFGLSFAGWNVLASLAVTALAFAAAVQPRKPPLAR